MGPHRNWPTSIQASTIRNKGDQLVIFTYRSCVEYTSGGQFKWFGFCGFGSHSKVVHTWYCQLFELLDVWFKIRKLCAYGATDTQAQMHEFMMSINSTCSCIAEPSTHESTVSFSLSTTLILFNGQSCKLHTMARSPGHTHTKAHGHTLTPAFPSLCSFQNSK